MKKSLRKRRRFASFENLFVVGFIVGCALFVLTRFWHAGESANSNFDGGLRLAHTAEVKRAMSVEANEIQYNLDVGREESEDDADATDMNESDVDAVQAVRYGAVDEQLPEVIVPPGFLENFPDQQVVPPLPHNLTIASPEEFLDLRHFPVEEFNGGYHPETVPEDELSRLFPSAAAHCPELLNRADLESCCAAPPHDEFRIVRFAYAVIMSGIDEEEGYHGYVANILMMRRVLARHDSVPVDFIVMVMMSDETRLVRFPDEVESAFRDYDVQLWYTEPLVRPNTFHSTQFAKINVLRLTQYERIIYLDADQFPFGGLDYWFLHHPVTNVGRAGPTEPCQGGFFMLQPSCDGYALARHKALWRYQHVFNESYGWGAPLGLEHTLKGLPTYQWSYHAADIDQGLLYHYLRHLANRTCDIIYKHNALFRYKWNTLDKTILPFYNDTAMMHFSGKKKPWLWHQLENPNTMMAQWRAEFATLEYPVPLANLSKEEGAHMLTKRLRPDKVWPDKEKQRWPADPPPPTPPSEDEEDAVE